MSGGFRREAGPVTARRFDWLLGFDKAKGRFSVAGVAWVDGQVEIVVDVPEAGGSFVLYLLARTPGEDGFARTEHLLVRYRGEAIPPVLQRLIEKALGPRLAGVTIDRLERLISDDPELGPALPHRGPTGDSRSPGPSDDVEEAPGPPRDGTGAAKRLRGRRKAGGPASMTAFDHLLGLDEAPEPYRVESCGWILDHLELQVSTESAKGIHFHVEERGDDDSKYFVKTDHLGLRYRAKHVPGEVSAAVLRFAPRRLARYRLDDLAAVLLGDPELGKPGLALPSIEHQHPGNLLDTWGAPDSFADFFAGGEIARGQLDSINMGKFFRNVQHCDIECLLVNVHGAAEPVSMVDFPWENRHRNAGAPRKIIEQFEPSTEEWDEADSMVSTDLTEQDVIMGNPDKLRNVLEYVTSLPNPQNKQIFVANTCVPTVTGEDVESVVKEFREKTKLPILYLTVTPKSMNDVFIDLLVRKRQAAERRIADPDPRSINLVGFANGRAMNELRQLLQRFGVRINVLLLPDIDLELVERLPFASLNVFFPNSLWGHMYDQLRLDSRIPHITPPAPYGKLGTRGWAKAIVDALAIDGDFDAVWSGYAASFETEWERVTAAAQGHRLGMIIRGEEIHYLLDPAQTWGVPIVEMTEEAGFGMDIALQVAEESLAAKVLETARTALPAGGDHTVVTFTDWDSFRETLLRFGCEAVLSHHVYDWRLSSAGKHRFTLQHFELGLPGAIRTIDRLTQICRTTFYRRYQKYLARTAEGLRITAMGISP